MHAMRGVVKAVSTTSLVVVRQGKSREEIPFALNDATLFSGSIVAGAVVSVRYRTTGTAFEAIAVVARSPRP